MQFNRRLKSTCQGFAGSFSKIVFVIIFAGMSVMGCGSGNDPMNPDMNIQLTASPAQVDLMEYSNLTASVKKAEGGKPLIEYSTRFSFAQNQSGGTLTPISSVTDTNGQSFCLYQAGSKSGIDIVQVTVDNNQNASASIVVAGGIDDTIVLNLTAAPVSLKTFEKSTVTLHATRQSSGQAVGGLNVRFSVSRNDSNGQLIQIPVQTDASGKAVAVYQSGENGGVDIVTVTLDNGQTTGVSLYITDDDG